MRRADQLVEANKSGRPPDIDICLFVVSARKGICEGDCKPLLKSMIDLRLAFHHVHSDKVVGHIGGLQIKSKL